jgi:hypothetical protein
MAAPSVAHHDRPPFAYSSTMLLIDVVIGM